MGRFVKHKRVAIPATAILLTGSLGLFGYSEVRHDANEPVGQGSAVIAVPVQDPNRSSSPDGAGPTDLSEVVETSLSNDPNWLHPRTEARASERQAMVERIRRAYGFDNEKLLETLQGVPRHWFVRAQEQRLAYADMPLPIGHGQTISQPFIVAYMTGLLDLTAEKRVLEVGTGSGYQAAVLSELTPHVHSIEIVEPLAQVARKRLRDRGYTSVQVLAADGYWGWKQHAPFDVIIVTCAADHVPPALIEQLKPNGKMCIPVGGTFKVQNLMLIEKDADGKVTSQSLMAVRFVPFVRARERD